jgi:hypothetical protein
VISETNRIIGQYKNRSKHLAAGAQWLNWLNALGSYPKPVMPWDAYVFCHNIAKQYIPNCRMVSLEYYAGPQWTMFEIMVSFDEGPHTYANYFNIVSMGDDTQAVLFKLANS